MKLSRNKASFNISNKTLLVSILSELSDGMMTHLQEEVLECVYKHSLKGVLIDVSCVEIIDSFTLRMLIDISKMAKLLGAQTRFAGMKSEIVASLVDFGEISKDFKVVSHVEAGFAELSNAN